MPTWHEKHYKPQPTHARDRYERRVMGDVGMNVRAWIGRPEGWKKPRGEWLGANEWGQLLAPAGTGANGKAMGIKIKIKSETNTALQPTRLRYAPPCG